MRLYRFHFLSSKGTGIVYAPSNAKGEIGVQIKGKKSLIYHKRLKIQIAASELYPADYDFSIFFDSATTQNINQDVKKTWLTPSFSEGGRLVALMLRKDIT